MGTLPVEILPWSWAFVRPLNIWEPAKDTQGNVCPVENVLAISPATDLRNENPEIDVINHEDPILSRKVIEEVATSWKGDGR